MKVFIAGAMTGIPEFNRPLFNEVAKQFEDNGDVVLNPAVLPDGLKHHEYLQITLSMIDVCDKVVMIDGWKMSVGATVEYHYAEDMGKIIGYWGKCHDWRIKQVE